MSTFYCICCQNLHESKGTDKVYTTGFRRLTPDQNVPLGVRQACQEIKEAMLQVAATR